MEEGKEVSLLVIMAVHNDWAALEKLLPQIDGHLGKAMQKASLLVVDDGSESIPSETLLAGEFASIEEVKLLRLRSRLGADAALAAGLAYAQVHLAFDFAVTMAGDGEDRPEDIVTLLREGKSFDGIVLARRPAHSESALIHFTFGIFSALFRLLTGHRAMLGRFGIFRSWTVKKLVSSISLAQSIPGALLKSELPLKTINVSRGKRLIVKRSPAAAERVEECLRVLSVFQAQAGARGFAVSALAAIVLFFVFLAALVMPYTGCPAHVSPAIAAMLFLQAVTLAAVFGIIGNSRRRSEAFLPLRDYKYCVLEVAEFGREEAPAE